MTKTSTLVKRFCKSLNVPTGRLAGHEIKLAPFQNRFIDGALGVDVNVGVLSVGRGNDKSSLSAMLCAGELLGAWPDAAEREIIIAARTEEQAKTTWNALLSLDEWLAYETDDLPPGQDQVVTGLNQGQSASMTAAFLWPQAGRIEAFGAYTPCVAPAIGGGVHAIPNKKSNSLVRRQT